jgi:polysaccharide biosynthesis/export protein
MLCSKRVLVGRFALIANASGYVAMTLVGSVLARNLTTRQLAGEIARRLREKYVKEPKVSVEVEIYGPFFILGEVRKPG